MRRFCIAASVPANLPSAIIVIIAAILFSALAAARPALAAQRPASATISADQAEEIVLDLPEVKAWSAHILRVTKGKVHPAVMTMPEEPISVEGRRQRYWSVGFFEDRPEEFHRWETFLVRVDGKQILVDSVFADEPMTLKQWRRTEKPMDRIRRPKTP